MKITLSCVVEGEADEVAALLSKVPAAFATTLDRTASLSDKTILASEDVAVTEDVDVAAENVEAIPDLLTPAPELDEPEQELPAQELPVQSRRQPAIKDQVVTFLERRKSASLADIAKATGIPSSKLSPRVAELKNAGVIKRATNKKSHNRYTLTGVPHEMSKVVQVSALRSSSERTDFLAILNALVDQHALSFRHLRDVTQIPVHMLTERCQKLEERRLIRSTGLDDAGEPVIVAVPPTRTTQLVTEDGTMLRDAVLECIRKHPDNTSLQIAIRLGRAYTDVARRIGELRRSGSLKVSGGISGAERWVATEQKLIPA